MTDNPADISPNFCIAPWAGIATSPRGGFKPCCWMSHEDSYTGPISRYTNSDYLERIKNQFLKGEYPKECKSCKMHDDLGISSKRIVENKKWAALGNGWNNYHQSKLQFIDLRLSNICNLGCITCSSLFSSHIQHEIKKHRGSLPDHWSNAHHDGPRTAPYSSDDIDGILEAMSPNAQIYCTGGEPSLDKKIMKLLEILLDRGYNKTVILKFNSNFQTLNKDWIKILKKFKGKMYPSIDGVDSVAEYIRYPCNWQQVDNNIRYFAQECKKSWEIEISPTISMLSIFTIEDVLKWTMSLKDDLNLGSKIYVHLGNLLHYPKYFDIRNLPEISKLNITEIFNRLKKDYSMITVEPQIDDIIKYMSQEKETPINLAINSLDAIDRMRTRSWRISLPQLDKALMPS